ATERLRTAGDPASAARSLGATHILMGSMQRERSFLRATVQLVATNDSRALWSAPVDTDSSSVFAIQDIIVTRVIEELAPRLATNTRRRLAQPGTQNNAAY